MSCDVGKATEGLENEQWYRWSDGKVGKWREFILQLFRCFTYVTVHAPTLLSLLLSHSIFTYVTWRAAHGILQYEYVCRAVCLYVDCYCAIIRFLLFSYKMMTILVMFNFGVLSVSLLIPASLKTAGWSSTKLSIRYLIIKIDLHWNLNFYINFLL